MQDELTELRALVKQNLALTEDIGHQVRKMRRAALWGRVFQLVWWGAIIVVSGAAYLYYLQPYIQKVIDIYEQVSGTTTTTYQSPDINKAVEQFVKSLGPTQK
ncbi:MAG: hypothetical protein QG621_304 [Patescibacteria group bacterium]|nr:hypothetical protein [Patescibacteria group bacterium]